MSKVLIANRGEIVVRIARTLAEMEIISVAIHSIDDAESLHVTACDQAVNLGRSGVEAYLDQSSIIASAKAAGCELVHPGYGFLSESAAFADACAEAGLVFIGPAPKTLRVLGDKTAARNLARKIGVPLARGSNEATSLNQARDFMHSLGGSAVMIKALSGGGGRGMRAIERIEDLPEAYARASSEAKTAFGCDKLYIEELIRPARHIEVQIIGDAGGNVAHLYERECSLQRQNQKVVEFAPARSLDANLRQRILEASVQMARAADVQTLCTMEFLVDESKPQGRFVFMEANPRLQVEHTVTEEIMGVDLVRTQIELAQGSSLADIGLTQDRVGTPRGTAVQLRINMETIDAHGAAHPSSGRLAAFAPPGGYGIRVETFGYPGYVTSTNYDSLLAKVIVWHPTASIGPVLRRAGRALAEFRIEGVETSIPFLRGLIAHPEVREDRFNTGTVERLAGELAVEGSGRVYFREDAECEGTSGLERAHEVPEGMMSQDTPIGGTVVSLAITIGDEVRRGQPVAVVEAMKMEHTVTASHSGIVIEVSVVPGQSIQKDQPLFVLDPQELGEIEAATMNIAQGHEAHLADLEGWRNSLSDLGRPEAVALQRSRGMMTARERIEAVSDPGSFTEIGGHVRNLELDRPAPADGVVTGSCRIDGRTVYILSQDFTVIGGSAGHVGDAKMIRLAQLARDHGSPLVMLLDGGGHRIQDGQSSHAYASGTTLFQEFARLSGWVPIVAAVLGYGFAANTNFAGMADFVAMVRGQSTMGIAGPALVKAGTGEVITTMGLGGADIQVDQNGLADAAFDTEKETLDAVRRFLSYLPSNARAERAPEPPFKVSNQAELERLVPTNTRRAYDMRRVIATLVDIGSAFEHRSTYGTNIITAYARLEGRAVGMIGNQPMVRGGMLDASACEKAARFIATCDAFGLPLVYLVDIPGMSIGSEAEASVLGRRSARMLFELGHATVPVVSVVLRKGYGLGFLAMAGGRSFDADAAFAWPTAEICAMSVEGSVDVLWKKSIDAAPNSTARRNELINGIRARIGPLQAAEGFGIDDLVTPQETRARIVDVLLRSQPRKNRQMPPKFRAISPI
ncbi:MAG: carboxyl transferase domain-containing protein [Rhodobacterales bacterium]